MSFSLRNKNDPLACACSYKYSTADAQHLDQPLRTRSPEIVAGELLESLVLFTWIDSTYGS